MVHANIWQTFLDIVKEDVGSRTVETWFKAITLSHWDVHSKTVYVKAPNTFTKKWVAKNYKKLFHSHFARILNENAVDVVFLDESEHKKSDASHAQKKQNTSENNSSTDKIIPAQKIKTDVRPVHVPRGTLESSSKHTSKSNALSLSSGYSQSRINKDFQFHNFVVGPHNSLAYAAAHAICEKPGNLYNPLFIYGASGLGKTHLLHAIGNKVKELYPRAYIMYQSTERFVHDFINAIRFDNIIKFEKKYKSADILLIDDVQFISHKEQTQEAFFHIFNALYDAGKQIVFSSDSLPKDIKGLAERVRSRLNGGLITDIQSPTLETKVAILQKKAVLHNCVLEDSVAYYIARAARSNIRELQGMLVRICAVASLSKKPITLELVQHVLEMPGGIPQDNKPLTLSFVAQTVADYFDYTLTEIRSSKRHQELTRARHVAMYCMKKFTNSSLSDIASYVKRKDHSTVIYAYEKIESRRNQDSIFKKTLVSIEKRLRDH
jgi:chromosomal replication initiator protein